MEFIEQLDGNVIVSDAAGIIIYMNKRAIAQYGKEIIGTRLMDCHNETSRQKIRAIMETHEKNVYTIEKKGKKKLIYQTPWLENGEFKGIVELSLEIPAEMPHFVRGGDQVTR